MKHPVSPLKLLHEKCIGAFYDYRKIASVFCCYSLIGTCLILGSSSLFGEDAFLYQLNEQTEVSSNTSVTPATASDENYVASLLNKVQTTRVEYSLTETHSVLEQTETKTDPTSAADISQQESLRSAADDAEQELTSKKDQTSAKKKTSLPYQKSDYSDKEIQILERIVEAEAGDQTIKGRMMVADVVLNRVLSEEFPDTIKAVVFQKNDSIYQFSPIKDGRYFEVSVSAKTKKAVEKAFTSEDLTDGALYFMSRSGSSKKNIAWFDSSLTKITAYGCHEFFK